MEVQGRVSRFAALCFGRTVFYHAVISQIKSSVDICSKFIKTVFNVHVVFRRQPSYCHFFSLVVASAIQPGVRPDKAGIRLIRFHEL